MDPLRFVALVYVKGTMCVTPDKIHVLWCVRVCPRGSRPVEAEDGDPPPFFSARGS